MVPKKANSKFRKLCVGAPAVVPVLQRGTVHTKTNSTAKFVLNSTSQIFPSNVPFFRYQKVSSKQLSVNNSQAHMRINSLWTVYLHWKCSMRNILFLLADNTSLLACVSYYCMVTHSPV